MRRLALCIGLLALSLPFSAPLYPQDPCSPFTGSGGYGTNQIQIYQIGHGRGTRRYFDERCDRYVERMCRRPQLQHLGWRLQRDDQFPPGSKRRQSDRRLRHRVWLWLPDHGQHGVRTHCSIRGLYGCGPRMVRTQRGFVRRPLRPSLPESPDRPHVPRVVLGVGRPSVYEPSDPRHRRQRSRRQQPSERNGVRRQR